jgi:hypothetical protein
MSSNLFLGCGHLGATHFPAPEIKLQIQGVGVEILMELNKLKQKMAKSITFSQSNDAPRFADIISKFDRPGIDGKANILPVRSSWAT